MADDKSTPENVVLKHLIELRTELREFRTETREALLSLRVEVSSLDQHVGALVTSHGQASEDLARLTARVERIERQLELGE